MNFIKRYLEKRLLKKQLLEQKNTWIMVAYFDGLVKYYDQKFRYSLILKENMLQERKCEFTCVYNNFSFRKEQSFYYMKIGNPWINGMMFSDIPSYDEVMLGTKIPKYIKDNTITDNFR